MSTPNAAQTTKIQRQSSSPVSTPPTRTPTPETSSVAAPHRPIAMPRLEPRKTSVTIDIDDGISSAPPAPASAIPAISTSTPGLAAASTDPPPKSRHPHSSIRRRPNTSASRPPVISSAENGIRNAVTVHCSSAIDVPSSRWIVGSAMTIAAVGSWTIPAAHTIAVSVRAQPTRCSSPWWITRPSSRAGRMGFPDQTLTAAPRM